MKTNLIIEDYNIEIDHNLFETIVENMPDVKENLQVHEKLSKSENWVVRDLIAKKENINRKTIKNLLKDKKDGIISSLLNNSFASQQIKHKELLKIIDRGNPTHAMIIVECLAYFISCDKDEIVNILSKHKDPNVRSAFVCAYSSSEVPKKILTNLLKDEDISIRIDAKKKLKR